MQTNESTTATPVAPQATVELTKNGLPVNDMTSKDYYFDSYAHFGIHEVKKTNSKESINKIIFSNRKC
jgi:hypothetical protein